jgi:hypothetical protein
MAKSARASSPDLFSVSAASDALGRSRRTVTKALAHVKPAKIVSGLKLWRLKDVIAAINRNTQAPLLTDDNTREFIAEFEASMKAWDAGFAALEAEPDLERRRALNEKLGVSRMIGPLDELIKEHNEAIGESEGCLAFVCDHMIGGMVSNILTLLDNWSMLDDLRGEDAPPPRGIRPWPAHIEREIDARK